MLVATFSSCFLLLLLLLAADAYRKNLEATPPVFQLQMLLHAAAAEGRKSSKIVPKNFLM